jgi:PBP1b-binding outer membrane lipoprotein LpoB
MGMHGMMMHKTISVAPNKVQAVNVGQAIDQMIEEAVEDLSSVDLQINSIAVWRIKSQTVGLNVEMIRRKLITKLVDLNQFKVLSRERLNELLDEQSLSLSGAIDEKSAVELGKLIGVDAFIDGYASIEDSRFMLNLNLVETKSGLIVWAKTAEESVNR